jgi:hypothetical protein
MVGRKEWFKTQRHDYLEILAGKQRKLTARWYARISGQVPWEDGEREKIDAEQEAIAQEMNRVIGLRELKSIEYSNK